MPLFPDRPKISHLLGLGFGLHSIMRDMVLSDHAAEAAVPSVTAVD